MAVSMIVVVSPTSHLAVSRQCAGLHVDGMLGFVRLRAAIFHLRDLRIGIVGVRPVCVRGLLLPLPIQSRQTLARGRLEAVARPARNAWSLSPVSRRTMLRIAAFASSVKSIAMVLPFRRPASTSRWKGPDRSSAACAQSSNSTASGQSERSPPRRDRSGDGPDRSPKGPSPSRVVLRAWLGTPPDCRLPGDWWMTQRCQRSICSCHRHCLAAPTIAPSA